MRRNEIEILLRLRDQVTAELKRVSGAVRGLEQQLEQAKAAARHLNAQFEAAAPASRLLMKALVGTGAALGGVGVKALATAGQFEQMQIAFTTMLGDAKKADRFLRQLYDFAAKTPFEIEGLQRQTQLLLALGFEAEEVIPTLSAVGDAVAALGGSSALLDRVVLALGQIKAKGKVSAEEMRQLAEAGIPAWEMLAKKIGTDVPTAMKLAERGAIDATTGITALLEGMNERFSGMMEKQSQTLLGIWSNIKDNLTRTLAALGADIDRTFHVREGMKLFLAWLDRVRSWFEKGGISRFLSEHRDQIIGLAGAIAGALVPAIVTATRAAVTGMLSFVRTLAPWAIAGYAAIKLLQSLGVSLADLKRWAALGAQAISGLGDIFGAFVANASGIVTYWRRVIGGMLDSFSHAIFFLDRAWDAIANKDVSGAMRALNSASQSLTVGLQRTFDSALEKSNEYFRRADDLAAKGMSKIMLSVSGTLGETGRAAMAALDDVAETAQQAAEQITGVAKTPIPELNTALSGATQSAAAAAGGISRLGSDAKTTAIAIDDLAHSLQKMSGYGGSQRFYERLGRGGAIVNAPGHGDIEGAASQLPDLPGWDWDLAGREAAANFAEGYADYLRDKGYHEMLADLSEYVAGYAAELEEDVREPFLRSLVSARNDVGIANAARDVERMLNQRIHDAMVRGSQDHGIQAAIKQQLKDSMKERDPMDALKSGSMDHGISSAIKNQQHEAEEAKRAFEAAASSAAEMAAKVSQALDDLQQMGEALTSGDVGGWFDGLSGMLRKIPGVVGQVLGETTAIFGQVMSWFQQLGPLATIQSFQQANAEYERLAGKFRLINQSAFAEVEQYQERVMFGLFSVDRYRVQINELALGIAQTLESGVLGGLRNAMKAFLEGAEDWYQQLKDGIKGAIENAIIEAVIQGAIIKGALGQMLSDLTDALAAGNTNAARQAIQGIADAIPQLADDLAEVLEPLRDALAAFGSSEEGASAVDLPATTSITYQLPTAPVLAAPSWVDEMGRHVARFGQAVDRLLQAPMVVVDKTGTGDLAYDIRALA